MRGLTHVRRRLKVRWLAARDRLDDRGAVAIMVGVALVGLIGMAAFVIDIGAVFEERRDLQNGADAAALALAMDCAGNGVCSAAAAQPEAENMANLNANDGRATVDASDIDFDLVNGTVTVTTHTYDTVDGDGEINHTLAPVLGSNSKAVSAEATAAWFALSGDVSTIPITFGLCEFNIVVLAGTGNPSPEDDIDWEEDGTSFEATIFFHTGEGQGSGGGRTRT